MSGTCVALSTNAISDYSWCYLITSPNSIEYLYSKNSEATHGNNFIRIYETANVHVCLMFSDGPNEVERSTN